MHCSLLSWVVHFNSSAVLKWTTVGRSYDNEDMDAYNWASGLGSREARHYLKFPFFALCLLVFRSNNQIFLTLLKVAIQDFISNVS